MKVARVIRYRGEDDLRDYKEALKKAKEYTAKAHRAIEEICELTEDMEDEYGDGYSERYSRRSYRRDEWDEEPERRRK